MKRSFFISILALSLISFTAAIPFGKLGSLVKKGAKVLKRPVSTRKTMELGEPSTQITHQSVTHMSSEPNKEQMQHAELFHRVDDDGTGQPTPGDIVLSSHKGETHTMTTPDEDMMVHVSDLKTTTIPVEDQTLEKADEVLRDHGLMDDEETVKDLDKIENSPQNQAVLDHSDETSSTDSSDEKKKIVNSSTSSSSDSSDEKKKTVIPSTNSSTDSSSEEEPLQTDGMWHSSDIDGHPSMEDIQSSESLEDLHKHTNQSAVHSEDSDSTEHRETHRTHSHHTEITEEGDEMSLSRSNHSETFSHGSFMDENHKKGYRISIDSDSAHSVHKLGKTASGKEYMDQSDTDTYETISHTITKSTRFPGKEKEVISLDEFNNTSEEYHTFKSEKEEQEDPLYSVVTELHQEPGSQSININHDIEILDHDQNVHKINLNHNIVSDENGVLHEGQITHTIEEDPNKQLFGDMEHKSDTGFIVQLDEENEPQENILDLETIHIDDEDDKKSLKQEKDVVPDFEPNYTYPGHLDHESESNEDEIEMRPLSPLPIDYEKTVREHHESDEDTLRPLIDTPKPYQKDDVPSPEHSDDIRQSTDHDLLDSIRDDKEHSPDVDILQDELEHETPNFIQKDEHPSDLVQHDIQESSEDDFDPLIIDELEHIKKEANDEAVINDIDSLEHKLTHKQTNEEDINKKTVL